MHLKDSREEYMGGLKEMEGRESCRNYLEISKIKKKSFLNVITFFNESISVIIFIFTDAAGVVRGIDSGTRLPNPRSSKLAT